MTHIETRAQITSKYIKLNDSFVKLPFFNVPDLKNSILLLEDTDCIDDNVIRMVFIDNAHTMTRFKIIELVEGDECPTPSTENYIGHLLRNGEVHYFFALREEHKDSIDLSKKRIYDLNRQEGLLANGK